MTQEQQVHNHLLMVGPITADVALREYCIRQLPTRIWRLRHRGVAIDSVEKSGRNAHGQRVRYTEYRLVS